MKIPKIIIKNKSKYIFVKQYPNFIRYKNLITGCSECFTKFDLGLIEKVMPKT